MKSLEVAKTRIWAKQCLLGIIKKSVIGHLPFFFLPSVVSIPLFERLISEERMSVVTMGWSMVCIPCEKGEMVGAGHSFFSVLTILKDLVRSN